ncbi:MAG: AlpA family transcriptional regulator [Mesorhizobium sp.]|uniref:helix-turn-helix transcriptional regulator n=1 Tax=Mesorhizobium TaxID=68287 RepID=UPI0012031501|nr:AlpA family transcriptional regulator [Mesorhizobium sp.]TIN90569.1 MAG: AlpA family transcriptional regulator [Mesorhizobium sp.]TJU93817.1 MAG: AlpA family transcriptional regulator [Mesorhizobium sp.]TJV37444.1 MAG: AlpA family transcriptional regulator [Mesorhizobium sp.]
MPEPDRIIRLKTVLARTGLSRSTIYRKIAEGTFPAQIKISVNGAGWRESDINQWVADPVSWHTGASRKNSSRRGGVVRCCRR